MIQTHLNKITERKKLKEERLELRKEVVGIVGEEVYDTVITNQRKMANASFVLEAINDAIDEDPLCIKDAIVAGIETSIEQGIDYFNWDIDFVSPKAVAEMVVGFINTLDETNVKLLGSNLNEFIRITDAMSALATKETLIKMSMNSHYGRN